MIDMSQKIYIHIRELDCYLIFPEGFFPNVMSRNGGKVPCVVHPRPVNDNAFHRWIDDNVFLDDGGGDQIDRNWDIEVFTNPPDLQNRYQAIAEHELDGEFVVVFPQQVKSVDEALSWEGEVQIDGCSYAASFVGIVDMRVV